MRRLFLGLVAATLIVACASDPPIPPSAADQLSGVSIEVHESPG